MFHKDYLDFAEISQLHNKYISNRKNASKNQIKTTMKRYFRELSIDYSETEKNLFIKKCDAEIFIDIYKDFDINKYYTSSKVGELLGLASKHFALTLYSFVRPVYYKRKQYFPRHKIDYFAKLKVETRPITDLTKELGWERQNVRRRVKRAVAELRSEGSLVDIIESDSHPLGNATLIKGYDAVKQRLEWQNSLESMSDRLEKFKAMTQKFTIENKVCRPTLLEFNDL